MATKYGNLTREEINMKFINWESPEKIQDVRDLTGDRSFT